MTNIEKLARLNAFRAAEGKAPFADWRNARHTPMLDAYLAEEATKAAANKSLAEVAGSADFGNHKELQAKAAAVAKEKTYKEVAHYDKSLVEKPVAFIHQFLSDNPSMTRKAAIFALTEGYGINFSTARTQYQRWFANRKRGE